MAETIRLQGSPRPALGECRDCNVTHQLSTGNAEDHARALADRLWNAGRLDLDAPEATADPRLSGSRIWGGNDGLMLGVLECRDSAGNPVILRGFSSALPGGVRHVDGWVPPVLPRHVHQTRVLPAELEIKTVTRHMEQHAPGSTAWTELGQRRQQLSRTLMDYIHDHTLLRNRRGLERTVREAFHGSGGIPGGTGDCCAPKLLVHAARNGLDPRGLAEFHLGGQARSALRHSGVFYAPCTRRCAPILGFLLCGLEP